MIDASSSTVAKGIRTVDDVRRKGGKEDRRELPRMGTLILEAVGGACGRR